MIYGAVERSAHNQIEWFDGCHGQRLGDGAFDKGRGLKAIRPFEIVVMVCKA